MTYIHKMIQIYIYLHDFKLLNTCLSLFLFYSGLISGGLAGPRNQRQRRIILTTDVAESSVTIPDVDLVIDCCTHKRPRWNPTLGFSDMGWTVNG